MNDNVTEPEILTRVSQAFSDVVEYFTRQDDSLSEKERLDRYEAAKALIIANPSVAVSFLGDQFENPAFIVKEAAYDLLISLGQQAVDSIKAVLDEKGERAQLWMTSVLHYHHDFSRITIFEKLLSSSEPYIRHLTGLATVFQGLAKQVDSNQLMADLIDSLMSEDKIENGSFFVADSGLSCITLLTGKRLTAAQKEKVEFYNFSHYLFEPPVHPFPYTSDRFTIFPVPERQKIASEIANWWLENRDTFAFAEVPGCFDY